MMKKLLLLMCSVLIFSAGNLQGQCYTNSTPGNNCTYGDAIDGFTLNSVASVGNFGCSAGGYTAYAAPIRTLMVGATYSWSAIVGGGSWNQGVGIWIDLNNDGIYTTNEMLASTAPAQLHSGTLTIPFTAVVANNVAMRVRCAYNTGVANTDGCTPNIGYYGETEDYLVNIVCPTAIPLAIAPTNTYLCLGQTTTLTGTGAQSYTWTGGISNGVAFTPNATTSYSLIGGISACPGVTNSAVATISVTNVPLNISATASTLNICAGSTTTLTASGASNFTWIPGNTTSSSNIVSPTASTTYTVIGYNGNGCPGASTLAISASPIPTISIVASQSVLCEGATTSLTASGGDTYVWTSPSSTSSMVVVSPTASTLYSVVGSNSSGCSSSGIQPVVVNAAPMVNTTASKATVCSGDAVTLSASGTANSYVWNGSITNNSTIVNPVSNTTYTVIGSHTLNICTRTKTIEINVYEPIISVNPSSAIGCYGSLLSFTASGGTNYTWTPTGPPFSMASFTVTAPAVYTVAAKSTSFGVTCAGQTTFAVNVHPSSTVTAVSDRTAICKGEKTTLTAGGATSYSWSTNQTGGSIEVGHFSGVVAYVVIGTDANGCQDTASIAIRVDNCTGITSMESKSTQVMIYPNPNKGNFTIESATNIKLNVINELGQIVKEVDLKVENSRQTSISDLPSGVYFIVGKNETTNVNQKIIVTK